MTKKLPAEPDTLSRDDPEYFRKLRECTIDPPMYDDGADYC